MFTPATVITAIIFYMLLLFAIAQFVEARITAKGQVIKSPWIYVLSIAVFHTSWTFYGSVGFTVENGLLFISTYLGALAGISLWWLILRRMVVAKNHFRITSIADFISTRYRRSQKIAGLVTLIALVGLLPYIALQLKAIVISVDLITLGRARQSHSALAITLLMIAFTIIFGVRRLDPTERHQGMIVALAVESLVKLAAFIAIGVFVTFFLFDGVSDLNQQIRAANLEHLTQPGTNTSMWLTLMVLGFAALYLLPRQFHVAVIENSDPKQIKTAMWLFPLYILLINLFVIPVAAAGLLNQLPLPYADYFVLLLPQQSENGALTLFAFIGGFAAATGMILITTMTLATMISNHWILPAIERAPSLQPLKSHLIQIRWGLVTLILLGSYWFEAEFSQSYILMSIGLLSFVAIAQFGPALFGGMFWTKGNSGGAFAGLLAGFALWCYTLALPAFVKHGWLDESLLLYGPWGVELLKPQALLGIEGLNPITHSLIWSLLVNSAFYILGSLIYQPHKEERTLTHEFMSALLPAQANKKARPTGLDAYIALNVKVGEAEALLSQYLPQDKANSAVQTITTDLQVARKNHITIIELVEFHRMLEHVLAGSIGAASAHSALEQHIRYSTKESNDLKALYSHIVSGINTHQVAGNEEQDKEVQNLPNGFGMLSDLQSQIDTLEDTLAQQNSTIETLENKLDARFEEIFKYRMQAQQAQQENAALKKQLHALEKDVSQATLSS